MTSPSAPAVMQTTSVFKKVIIGAVPLLFAGAAYADCANEHIRSEIAEKVEILFKNETDESIDLTVQKADGKTPNDKKVVQSKTVEAGKKVDFSGSLGDNAEKIFYVSFSGLSGEFLVANAKTNTANGVSRDSLYEGRGMMPVRNNAFVECDTKFKGGSKRWSVSVQVN